MARDKNAEDVGAPKPDYKRNQWGLCVRRTDRQGQGALLQRDRYQTENKSFTVNSGQPQFYSKLEGVFPTNYLRHKYFVRGDWQATQSQAVFVRYGKDWEHIDCEGLRRQQRAFNQSYVESPRTHQRGRAHVGRQQPRAERVPRAVPGGAPQHDRTARNVAVGSPGRVPGRALHRLLAGLQLPEHALGLEHRQPELHQALRAEGGLLVFRGQPPGKFGAECRALHLAGRRHLEPRDVDVLHRPVLRRYGRVDRRAAQPDDVHRLVPERGAQAAELLDQRLRAGRVEAPQQPDAQSGRSLRPAVPLVQQPVQLRRTRVAEAADRPATVSDNNNIGPRVGMAWDVRNDTKTLVRAAYGRFYQYLPQGGAAQRAGDAAAEQHQHHQPDVSGSRTAADRPSRSSR